jgi:predicted AAA+ superfamily ATPase
VTRDGREVDFVLQDGPRERPRLVQVCWSLRDKDVRRREEVALRQAMEELRTTQATVVTWTDDESLGDVAVVPAWKWLLGDAARG